MHKLDDVEAGLASVVARILEIGKGRFFPISSDDEGVFGESFERTLAIRYTPEERGLRIQIGRLPAGMEQHPAQKYSTRHVRSVMSKIDGDFFVLGEADKIANLLQLNGFAFVDVGQVWTFHEHFEVARNYLEFADSGQRISISFEAKRNPR